MATEGENVIALFKDNRSPKTDSGQLATFYHYISMTLEGTLFESIIRSINVLSKSFFLLMGFCRCTSTNGKQIITNDILEDTFISCQTMLKKQLEITNAAS